MNYYPLLASIKVYIIISQYLIVHMHLYLESHFPRIVHIQLKLN